MWTPVGAAEKFPLKGTCVLKESAFKWITQCEFVRCVRVSMCTALSHIMLRKALPLVHLVAQAISR